MTPPINRLSVLAAFLADRLTEIQVVNGYVTDIGLRPFRGRRSVDASNAPCVVLIEGQDDPQDQSGGRDQVVVKQQYAISAFVACDPDNPNDAANEAVEDITHALFREGARMDGRVQKIDYAGRDIGPRPDGEATVQVVVHVHITIAQNLTRN